MALTKETSIDLIELRGPFRTIEIRTTTRIIDDGVIIADKIRIITRECFLYFFINDSVKIPALLRK